MGINQKEAVAALHRARMLTAAEELFQQKGFEATTIDDISKASGYSRRTLYAYFVNKEDFLRDRDGTAPDLVRKSIPFIRRKMSDQVINLNCKIH